jgi:hypothetical protein
MNNLLNEGMSLGIKKAVLAGNKAGEVWKQEAYLAFVTYATTHKFFTVEQVRKDLSHVSTPPDKRAWGVIALQAKKHNIVKNAGWTRSLEKNKHGIPVALWQSLVFNTTQKDNEK